MDASSTPERSGIEVRIEPPDGEAARLCLAAYFRELTERFEGGFLLDPEEAEALSDFQPPKGEFLVAYLGPEPVGCVGVKRLDHQTGELKRMWISPEKRGRGIARALLDVVEARARRNGWVRLRLDTNRVLTEAHRLYRSAGFTEIERYNDNPYAHLWFEKAL